MGVGELRGNGILHWIQAERQGIINAGQDLSNHPVQLPAPYHHDIHHWTVASRAASMWVLNISKEGDSTASLLSPFRHVTTLSVEKIIKKNQWKDEGVSLFLCRQGELFPGQPGCEKSSLCCPHMLVSLSRALREGLEQLVLLLSTKRTAPARSSFLLCGLFDWWRLISVN